MANCTNCAAPLPADSISCEYCGSRNDVDLNGVHYHTTHAPDTERICPRCDIPLKTIELGLNGPFLIERCDTCLGLFFDPNEMETLLEAQVTNVYDIDRNRLSALSAARRTTEYGIVYIKCPVCSTRMNRVNCGAKSGVVVDRCRDHGVWLDGGELRQLMEWMKAGGKLLDRQLEAERKKDAEAFERHWKQPLSQSGGLGGPSGLDIDLGGGLGYGGHELLDIVVGAVRFIFK